MSEAPEYVSTAWAEEFLRSSFEVLNPQVTAALRERFGDEEAEQFGSIVVPQIDA